MKWLKKENLSKFINFNMNIFAFYLGNSIVKSKNLRKKKEDD